MCRGSGVKIEAPKCADVLTAKKDGTGFKEWVDSDLDSCKTYRKKLWCNTNNGEGKGGVGWAWTPSDKFEDFKDPVSELHAGEACCGCGGGIY
jgi:hypothetical protein